MKVLKSENVFICIREYFEKKKCWLWVYILYIRCVENLYFFFLLCLLIFDGYLLINNYFYVILVVGIGEKFKCILFR